MALLLYPDLHQFLPALEFNLRESSDSANVGSYYEKLCSLDFNIRDICKSQRSWSTMAKHHPGQTTFLITVYYFVPHWPEHVPVLYFPAPMIAKP